MTDFNNLVPVTETQLNGKLQQTVSAKALHNYLKVGNDSSTWIKGRIKEYGLIKNDDFLIFDSSEFRNQSTNNEQQIKWTTRRGGDRKSTDYILTIGTAKELAMIENNEKGRAIRKYFIRCEEHLKEIAPAIQKKALKRLKARLEVADYSRPMCDALTIQRLSLGKETKPHHYTNEFDMINRIVLGMTAKAYRKAHNLTGDIRDHITEEQLNHLAYLEKSNITLIDMGWNYEKRKAELIKLSQSYMIRLLGKAA
ncbi:antA/AntB antirepressor family protein [Gilliamella sp. B2894]|uniref:antA/AntB antirepressor family protein n=1 Tax=unclassified Gilliamella TaxID=2685620 RepID=UPI00226A1321|nr:MULTISPECIES: antA/AntB antirepressor family protein [unclassified Gilliamella]MCX8655542.1 antA/AntB antirepressor family protein [Gilliamella sp. B2894]MCX8694872.1 antA/AntB antirepressor family protein [Gilliamella sp. B2881]